MVSNWIQREKEMLYTDGKEVLMYWEAVRIFSEKPSSTSTPSHVVSLRTEEKKQKIKNTNYNYLEQNGIAEKWKKKILSWNQNTQNQVQTLLLAAWITRHVECKWCDFLELHVPYPLNDIKNVLFMSPKIDTGNTYEI